MQFSIILRTLTEKWGYSFYWGAVGIIYSPADKSMKLGEVTVSGSLLNNFVYHAFYMPGIMVCDYTVKIENKCNNFL